MRRALKLVSQGAVTIEQRCHDICKYTYIIYMLQWHFLVENVTQMTSLAQKVLTCQKIKLRPCVITCLETACSYSLRSCLAKAFNSTIKYRNDTCNSVSDTALKHSTLVSRALAGSRWNGHGTSLLWSLVVATNLQQSQFQFGS